MQHSHEKLYLSLVSAPATRAVYQRDGWILGLCACYPCSLPECSPTMSWWFNNTLQVSSVMLCWVEWCSRRLVLRLFPLPCHVVCHTFVWARAALDQTGHASNSVFSVIFFVCQRLLRISFLQWLVLIINLIRLLHGKTVFLKCCNASEAHWSHVLSAFTIITISIWMSVCEIQRNGTLSKTTV